MTYACICRQTSEKFIHLHIQAEFNALCEAGTESKDAIDTLKARYLSHQDAPTNRLRMLVDVAQIPRNDNGQCPPCVPRVESIAQEAIATLE